MRSTVQEKPSGHPLLPAGAQELCELELLILGMHAHEPYNMGLVGSGKDVQTCPTSQYPPQVG